MELEQQCPHQSFQPGSFKCTFDENQIDKGKICLSPPTTKSSSISSSDDSSFLRRRRRNLFAVKALAIIVLLGYIGREHSLGVVQKFSSGRRLTYVGSSSSSSSSHMTISLTKLGFSASSKTSNTIRQQKVMSLDSTNSTTTTTMTGLRGVSESKPPDESPNDDGVVKAMVSPKD